MSIETGPVGPLNAGREEVIQSLLNDEPSGYNDGCTLHKDTIEAVLSTVPGDTKLRELLEPSLVYGKVEDHFRELAREGKFDDNVHAAYKKFAAEAGDTIWGHG